MKSRNARVAGLLLSTAAVAVAVMAFVGAFASADSSSQPSQGESLLSAPSAAQVAAFPVLGRKSGEPSVIATSPDALEELAEAESEHGVNPRLARTVLSSANVSEAIVPGRDTICLVQTRGKEQTAAYCGAESSVEKEGLSTDGWENGGERWTVTGVFPHPDGIANLRTVSESGAEAPVQLSAGGGYTVVTSVKPTALKWTDPDGAQQSRAVFWPPLH